MIPSIHLVTPTQPPPAACRHPPPAYVPRNFLFLKPRDDCVTTRLPSLPSKQRRQGSLPPLPRRPSRFPMNSRTNHGTFLGPWLRHVNKRNKDIRLSDGVAKDHDTTGQAHEASRHSHRFTTPTQPQSTPSLPAASTAKEQKEKECVRMHGDKRDSDGSSRPARCRRRCASEQQDEKGPTQATQRTGSTPWGRVRYQ